MRGSDGARMAKTSSRNGRATRGSRSRPSKPAGLHLTSAQRSWLAGLCLLAVALLTFLSLISTNHGLLTGLWLELLRRALGWGAWAAPIALTILGVWVISLSTDRPLALPWTRLLGLLILLLMSLALSTHFSDQPEEAALAGRAGGYTGYWLSHLLALALGWAGATVIMVTIIGIGLTLALDVSLAEVMADFTAFLRRVGDWLHVYWLAWRSRWRAFRARLAVRRPAPRAPSIRPVSAPVPQEVPRASQLARPAIHSSEGVAASSPDAPVAAEPRILTGFAGEPVQWTLPKVEEILEESIEAQMSLSDIREKTHTIEETLRSLGVPVTVVEVNPGPVVTQFGLEPGYIERRDRQGKVKRVKIKVSRISALSNDLALALAASPIRIEAPVPGKGIVGLEIPNNESAVVGLRGVMESEAFTNVKTSLALAFGRDVSGAALADDMTKLPHLLIAGATGSGKSVCINAMVASLLFRNTPDQLKMMMIDPKRVELSLYNGIPHLLAPVVVETDRVVGVLNWVTREMDRRYRVFAQVGVRNVQGYNDLAAGRGDERMPYIVVFIDELADLMMVAPEEVERSICRIAQMARATGIHMVIATQRPSVDVITGLIKANFPARIAFAVSSQIDSRVILDVPGADKLLGRGDALYMAPDSPKLMRMQGCWVSDAELNRLVTFWKEQVRTGGTASAGVGIHPPTSFVQKPLWAGERAEGHCRCGWRGSLASGGDQHCHRRAACLGLVSPAPPAHRLYPRGAAD